MNRTTDDAAEGAYTETIAPPPGRQPAARALRKRPWLALGARGHAVAPLDSLIDRVEGVARATGQTVDEAAAVVVEDIERDAGALTTRTAPLVPACGVLVAISGLAVKAEPGSHPFTEAFVSLAVLFAVSGLAFLTRALFLYAGRPVIGLAPSVADIPFARNRLVRKHASARRGGLLAGLGLACLIIGILAGVHINIG